MIQDRKVPSPSQKMTPTKFGDGIDIGLCPYCSAFDGFQHLCNQVGISLISKEDPTQGLDNNQSNILDYGDKSKLVHYKAGEKQDDVKEVTPATEGSYGWVTGYSKMGELNVLIFYPGGNVHNSTGVTSMREVAEAVMMVLSKTMVLQPVQQSSLEKARTLDKQNVVEGGLVPNDHSKGVYKMIKDLSRFPELKLGALINIACDPPEEWQEYLEFMGQMEHVAGAQGRQGKIGRLVGLGDHETSKKSVTIYVFDPGGMKW